MLKQEFTFYRTMYKNVKAEDPITIGYNDATPKNIEYVKEYPGSQFIHSGNFWNIPKD